MFSYGIMQGRLTPSKGRGIQFFPFDNWKQEFFDAAEIGLQEIEWIFDYDDYEKNPLWSGEGCQIIKSVMDETGVAVHSICFDYFMRRPFYKYPEDMIDVICEENYRVFDKVILHTCNIGARLIEVPLVDASSVKTTTEEKIIIKFLDDISQKAKGYGVAIGIESDYRPEKFSSFLGKFTSGNIVANYDSGNSSGLGYDTELEITSLDKLLFNLHIKDRKLHGATMRLGTGNADFDKVFCALKRIGYKNSIILQAARGQDGLEKENIEEQLAFVRAFVDKYQL